MDSLKPTQVNENGVVTMDPGLEALVSVLEDVVHELTHIRVLLEDRDG